MKIVKGKEQEYQECCSVNSSPYGRACVEYAKRWAELMEKEIESSGDIVGTIKAKAEDFSHKADTEGITGFMYGCAVNILSQLWEYGEELRKWHNNKYGCNGDGVVNPAIITVSIQE